MDAKKNIPLILGLSIPILMILFVAGIIYLPGLFIQPKFNFLYATEDYYFPSYYSVKNGRLIKNNKAYCPEFYKRKCTEPRLYIYDITKNESKEISFSEAQRLTLNSNSRSPDGFEITCGRRTQSIFFIFVESSSDCSTRFIKGHNISKKLNLQLSKGRYGSFRFLGWIIK